VTTRQRAGVDRRSVVRGAAWAAPVAMVGVAVPAYAASVPCQPSTAPLEGLNSGSTVSFLPFSDTSIQAHLIFNTNHPRAGDPSPFAPGDTGTIQQTSSTTSFKYLKLHHPAGASQGDWISMTMQFTSPVSNLSLKIVDIDKDTGQWIDHIVVSPAGFAVDAAANNVVGSGTSTDPFRSTVEGDISTGSAAGHRTLTWAGPLQAVNITYLAKDQDNASDIGQHIGVTAIQFANC
jgi:hypothetical protein